MITKKLTIVNKLGIHARPAAQFVRKTTQYASEVSVEIDGEVIDGKSIMGLMMLAVGWGAEINVTVEGSDEEACMAEIEALIASKFGEE